MEGGNEGDIDKQGIIPRTIKKIYEETKNLVEKVWNFLVILNWVRNLKRDKGIHKLW